MGTIWTQVNISDAITTIKWIDLSKNSQSLPVTLCFHDRNTFWSVQYCVFNSGHHVVRWISRLIYLAQ